ncbi:NADH:flavin oxidoreductase/NADH oxidase [Marihabitans asiaticum]|uniref:2,4-dienoyl-CoA reductase-like NADH-dependent reductase (Old Yellow Enzyme family) n=1 Tax=Marihabitans asiaticum TaxID=415218 RepID=A0A560WGE4_9MICO|nr:NADH:flavin oxidoreductase/NADH oxidase [Marihabitans asiaticum]TWD16747.1 2,4-dienoyl-CoA reductase-like NADH-dependent reductase (Old Yellow Enzyme family) [Marihabitans asiaticum]
MSETTTRETTPRKTTPSPALFEPITLRELTIRNRIWLAPMCQYSCEGDGVPTDWHLVHLGARAVGGFGLILTEAAAVAPEGRISPQDAGIWDDTQRDAWRRVVDFVRAQGAAIGIQLAHAGRKASTYRPFAGEPKGAVPADDGGWPTLGPSSTPFEGLPTPREMTAQDIEGVVAAFADAARRADQAGFDVVEIHGAHGYLIHSFLSPLSNHRDDGYGGSLEGRARLLLEIVDAVRAVWPEGKPVLVRLSGTDWVDGGWDIEQTATLASWLTERAVDLVDVSSGGNVIADIPLGPGYQVPLASRVREAGVVTGAVGLITDPAQAEAILTGGHADAVLLARAALREPSWPQRAAAELGLTWREAPYPPQYTRGAWPTE